MKRKKDASRAAGERGIKAAATNRPAVEARDHAAPRRASATALQKPDPAAPSVPAAAVVVGPPPATAPDWGKLAQTSAGARVLQTDLLFSAVYQQQIAGLVGTDGPLAASAQRFVSDVIDRLAPRDPVEEMLVGQMLWTHLRVARMSVSALKQSNPKAAQVMHQAADQAANTFRRQMLALAEYRRPPRPEVATTTIRQANIAGQQIVVNGNGGGGNGNGGGSGDPAGACCGVQNDPAGELGLGHGQEQPAPNERGTVCRRRVWRRCGGPPAATGRGGTAPARARRRASGGRAGTR